MEDQDNPLLKYSQCQKCEGYVRCAVLQEISRHDIEDFIDEAKERNLLIHELPLLEFNKLNLKFCGCKL